MNIGETALIVEALNNIAEKLNDIDFSLQQLNERFSDDD